MAIRSLRARNKHTREQQVSHPEGGVWAKLRATDFPLQLHPPHETMISTARGIALRVVFGQSNGKPGFALDTTRMTGIQIYLTKPKQEATLELSDLKAYGSPDATSGKSALTSQADRTVPVTSLRLAWPAAPGSKVTGPSLSMAIHWMPRSGHSATATSANSSSTDRKRFTWRTAYSSSAQRRSRSRGATFLRRSEKRPEPDPRLIDKIIEIPPA